MPANTTRSRHLVTLFAVAAFAVGVSGCNDKKNASAATTPSANPTATPAPAPTPTPTLAATASAAPSPSTSASAGPSADVLELKIASVGDTMAFDVTSFTVPAGRTAHLTLKNNSTMKAMPHNWVLVKPGTEAKVAAAGLKKGEALGYIDAEEPDMLAHSPLAEMGSTVDFTFTTPKEPGTYPFICTTPGHYIMMKGTLVVTP